MFGLIGLIAGCALVEGVWDLVPRVPPPSPEQVAERMAELRTRAAACNEALPGIQHYVVYSYNRVFAEVRYSYYEPAPLPYGYDYSPVLQNFDDCVFGRGQWASWAAGQPAPVTAWPQPRYPRTRPIP